MLFRGRDLHVFRSQRQHPAPTERGKPRTQPDRSFHQTENRGLDNVGIENLQGVGSRERSYPTDESRVFRQTQQRANRMEGHRKAYRGQNQAERACFLLPYMRTQHLRENRVVPALQQKQLRHVRTVGGQPIYTEIV